MNSKLKSLILCLAAAAGCVGAANDPYDLEYRVLTEKTGTNPAAVFNDGAWTYIQLQAGQHGAVLSAPALRDGPYLVIRSVPDTFTLQVNGSSVYVQRVGRVGQVTAQAEVPVSAVDGRLAYIGSVAEMPKVRPVLMVTDLVTALRTLAPRGWRGTAEADVDVARDLELSVRPTDSWAAALNRVLEIANLYAEVDFEQKRIHLRTSPPAAFALAAAPGATAATPPVVWRVLKSDEWLSRTLARWAEIDGRKFSWEASTDLPVVSSMEYAGTLDTVLDAVRRDLAGLGAKLTIVPDAGGLRVLDR